MAGVRVDTPQWACVHTHIGAERWAEANLRQKGYTTWLPMVTVRRRDRVVRSMFHDREIPAFARYVFIRHAPGEPWTPIRYTEGVCNLLTMDGLPSYASEASVSALQAALSRQGYADTGPVTHRPGTPLKWRTGAYAGLDAIAISSDAKNTIVAVVMLGALRNVSVPTADLVPR